MVIFKSNFSISENEDKYLSRLAHSLSDLALLLEETSHVINGLSKSLDTQRLIQRVEKLKAALESCNSFKDLKAICSTLTKLRLDLREVCRRSSSTVSDNWQSPPMESALDASVQQNSKQMLSNGVDYHRALHLAGINYERFFLEHILGNPEDCSVLATASGMAAITTALQFLAHRTSTTEGPIVIDQGCYHETRFLAETIFYRRLRYLDLSSQKTLEILPELKPALVIFDSTRNSKNLKILPISDILNSLQKCECFLLIDSTSLVNALPIIAEVKSKQFFNRTIIATSLAKMHQYGLDLVTAGALIFASSLDEKFPGIKNFRTHLGANITEDSAVILPKPSLDLLQHRAERISRNVNILSSAMIKANLDISVETAKCWGFPELFAPYFNLTINHGSEIDWYRPFINRIMIQALRRDIPIIAGASFGFDVSRIYLVESLIPTHSPFIRLAPGMESSYEIELLAEAIIEAAKEK